MAEKITLTKQDRKKVWWRHQFLQGSWNYERMQNGGWCYSIIPAIKKLYPNKEDQIAALKRHMEFYNTHPYVSSPVMGVTLALEEEKANGENVDDSDNPSGLRIGTQEITRRGLKEKEMDEVAEFIKRVAVDKENIKDEVREFMDQYTTVHYSFSQNEGYRFHKL